MPCVPSHFFFSFFNFKHYLQEESVFSIFSEGEVLYSRLPHTEINTMW